MWGTAGPPAPASQGSGHAPLRGAPGMHRSCLLDPATPRLSPEQGKEREIGIQREQLSVGSDGSSDLVDESKLLQTAALVGSGNGHGICACVTWFVFGNKQANK